MATSNNLPSQVSVDSADTVKHFFDKFFLQQISFPANEIDATVAFFLKHGFDTDSARSTSIVLLNQARADNVPVFSLIDTLRKLSEIQLSQVVAQVLNASRDNVSLLGYRIANLADNYESRNILI